MAFKWYAIQTYVNREKKVKEKIEEIVKEKNLQNKIRGINVPMIKVAEMKNGKKHIADKKIMPGYVLIELKFDSSVHGIISNIPNVVKFVSNKPLSDEEVENLLITKDSVHEETTNAMNTLFQIGETVKIVDGPFANFTGTISALMPEKEMIRIKVNIIGQPTAVDINYLQVASNMG